MQKITLLRTFVLLAILSSQTYLKAQTPIVLDVYAATLVSTAEAPQSALINFEGTGTSFNSLIYSIVAGPSHGTLRTISGSTVSYTPTDDFVGIDTFTYIATQDTDDSATKTVTINVFNSYLDVPQQLGQSINGLNANNYSGSAVSLSSNGQIVAIGAYGYNEVVTSQSLNGQVRVFQNNSGSWEQMGGDINGETNEHFGSSVALSSDGLILAIGAPGNDDNAPGLVQVFQYSDDSWNQKGEDIIGAEQADRLGEAIALSNNGQIIAVGSKQAISYKGNVRVFQYESDAWNPLGDVIDGQEEPDFFGNSVALSSDGHTLAVGAEGANNGGGQVRLYQYSTSGWSEAGNTIDGDADPDPNVFEVDRLGSAIALSSDGLTLAVGANGNNNSTGHTKLFNRTT